MFLFGIVLVPIFPGSLLTSMTFASYASCDIFALILLDYQISRVFVVVNAQNKLFPDPVYSAVLNRMKLQYTIISTAGIYHCLFWILYATQIIPWNAQIFLLQFLWLDILFRVSYLMTLSSNSQSSSSSGKEKNHESLQRQISETSPFTSVRHSTRIE